MSKLWYALPAAAVLLLVGACDTTGSDNDEFVADLAGGGEVPPRTTTASGQATFTLRGDGSVAYAIDVSGITNVVAAHIHAPAATDANAGVIVTLFSGPRTGLVNGRLAQGNFTRADLTTTGAPLVPMDSVLTWMRTGRAYVNVHTSDGVDPPNTGAGDFPGGEIRGQIRLD